MEISEELKKWVGSLTVAEKRGVKLLGKARAGATTSQQLELFDWLNQAADGDAFPAKAKFMRNLPTVSNRLKDLILDSLRMLNKETDIDAGLRTALDNIAILHGKKLIRPAIKHIKRAKKLALDSCRYLFALQCIEWEQKIVQAGVATDTRELLKELRDEERDILKKLEEQREVQSRHDSLLALVRQSHFRRDAQTSEEVSALPEHEIAHRLCESGGYVEQAVAVNLLGLKDLYERNPVVALVRYQKLLAQWQAQPAWQHDQSALLLLICKFYQTACFFSPVRWEQARHYIVMDFKGMSPDGNRDFQRMLYHNQYILALNTGKFDSVKVLIEEIDKWLTQEEQHLTEIQVLPFLCNFAVAEFLAENFSSANRIVSRILNMPNRNARKDIREFALVLQAVLQSELNNTGLNEYLTRSGKRYFSKNAFEVKFELIVFRHLDDVMHLQSRARQAAISQFIHELDDLAEQMKDRIPVLGLNEIRMWAQAKQAGKPLKEIFLKAVSENLKELEQASAPGI